jgi:hypothetical protein
VVGFGDSATASLSGALASADPSLAVSDSGGGYAVLPTETRGVSAQTPVLGPFVLPSVTVGEAAFTVNPPASESTGAFSFTSTNPAVATVSPSGLVTPVAAGTTGITVTQAAATGYSAASTSGTLTVLAGAPAPAPTLGSFAMVSKKVGEASYTVAPPTSNSAGAFSFYSSNPAVASITAGGTVTILSAGSATINVTQAAAPGYSAGSKMATLLVTDNVLEWKTLYSVTSMGGSAWAGSDSGCRQMGYRLPTAAELVAKYNMHNGNGEYYWGWHWASDESNGWHKIVNMVDGRVGWESSSVRYNVTCVR